MLSSNTGILRILPDEVGTKGVRGARGAREGSDMAACGAEKEEMAAAGGSDVAEAGVAAPRKDEGAKGGRGVVAAAERGAVPTAGNDDACAEPPVAKAGGGDRDEADAGAKPSS